MAGRRIGIAVEVPASAVGVDVHPIVSLWTAAKPRIPAGRSSTRTRTLASRAAASAYRAAPRLTAAPVSPANVSADRPAATVAASAGLETCGRHGRRGRETRAQREIRTELAGQQRAQLLDPDRIRIHVAVGVVRQPHRQGPAGDLERAQVLPGCSVPGQVGGHHFWFLALVCHPVIPVSVYGALLARDVPLTQLVEIRYVPDGRFVKLYCPLLLLVVVVGSPGCRRPVVVQVQVHRHARPVVRHARAGEIVGQGQAGQADIARVGNRRPVRAGHPRSPRRRRPAAQVSCRTVRPGSSRCRRRSLRSRSLPSRAPTSDWCWCPAASR